MIATGWQEHLRDPGSVRWERYLAGTDDLLAHVTPIGTIGGAEAVVTLQPRIVDQFFTLRGALAWADRILRERGVTLPEDYTA